MIIVPIWVIWDDTPRVLVIISFLSRLLPLLLGLRMIHRLTTNVLSFFGNRGYLYGIERIFDAYAFLNGLQALLNFSQISKVLYPSDLIWIPDARLSGWIRGLMDALTDTLPDEDAPKRVA